MRKKGLFYSFGLMAFLVTWMVTAIYLPVKVSAVSASSWQAGNIIDDLVFTDSNSMSLDQIQNFLNSMNPSCDTFGTQPATEYGRSDLTHSQYAAQVGWPGPPYVCLKNYYEVPKTSPGPDTPDNSYNHNGNPPAGSISAANMIYDAAQKYHINPRVLLVKIHKESAGPLTTDTWPLQVQYKFAMGAHCPDSGPNHSANCDPNYAGFSIQISEAAALLRYYLDNMSQSWWPYKKMGANSIQYNPDPACGSSIVNITTLATAALYTYTPYQPNDAALQAGYGTAPCGAYGNRNFWLYYNDWFGSTQYQQTLVSYKSHLSGLGWTGTTTNGGSTGTTGQGRTMEAFKINGEVEYSSYNFETGWQPTVNYGMISGTTGQSKPIQAIKINPVGSLANNYEVYYRAHVSNIGWMGWTKNGLPAGITGDANNNIEAIEVYLAPKGFYAPGNTDNSYKDTNVVTYNPPLSLSIVSHVGSVGWQPTVTNNMVTGTTEQSKRIEAIKLNLNNTTGLGGDVVYSAHVSSIGWQDWVKNGALAGTTGQSKQMEAIRIALTGQLGDSYDIWYRPYVQNMGWLDWAKNGRPAGSVGAARQLEAVEIRLATKDSSTLPQTNNFYNPSSQPMPDTYSISYVVHVSNIGWTKSLSQNMVAGTTGQSKTIEAFNFGTSSSIFGDIAINCSGYVKNSGWTSVVAPTSICGSTGKSTPLESIKLTLSGSGSDKYDLYYKVHLSFLGWQDWVKNGDQAGTPSSGKPIEAIIVKLVQK